MTSSCMQPECHRQIHVIQSARAASSRSSPGCLFFTCRRPCVELVLRAATQHHKNCLERAIVTHDWLQRDTVASSWIVRRSGKRTRNHAHGHQCVHRRRHRDDATRTTRVCYIFPKGQKDIPGKYIGIYIYIDPHLTPNLKGSALH